MINTIAIVLILNIISTNFIIAMFLRPGNELLLDRSYYVYEVFRTSLIFILDRSNPKSRYLFNNAAYIRGLNNMFIIR